MPQQEEQITVESFIALFYTKENSYMVYSISDTSTCGQIFDNKDRKIKIFWGIKIKYSVCGKCKYKVCQLT